MALSLALCAHRYRQLDVPCCRLRLDQKYTCPVILGVKKENCFCPFAIMPDELKSDFRNGDNGPNVPARVLLERLVTKTQKLEEIMDKDSSLSEEVELSMSLEGLELDLQVALSTLMKKEEDLRDAEKRVLLDQANLNHTKQLLERREEEIATACAKQKQMEEDLNQAYCDLGSQSRQIEDLKHLVEVQEKKIASSKSVLSLKEDELEKLRNELAKNNEQEATMSSELDSKNKLLSEAYDIIKEQEQQIQELQREVKLKEDELARSFQIRKDEKEMLKNMEVSLEQRTIEWLSAREELKELTTHASKHLNDMKETSDDIKRVRALLSDVRSELISSQQSLVSSHRKMEDQADQFAKELAELSEKKLILMSQIQHLQDAQLELENERAKLRSAQAQHEELEMQLATDRIVIEQLQEELNRERSSLKQGTQEIAFLQKELQRKELEYCNAQNLLQLKESDLVEDRLQIQNLKSEQVSLQLILKEKDAELSDAQKKLADMNQDIAELQRLMNGKEHELTQVTTRLREKEEHISTMQHELDDTKHKFFEAASTVERIVQLTNKLVLSAKYEDSSISCQLDEASVMSAANQDVGSRMWKELDNELDIMKKLLQTKERGLLAAQRALEAKNEEPNMILKRLDATEKELEKMRNELWEDANGLKRLYSRAQERIEDGTLVYLAIEKPQIEAAHLEAEAATAALQNLAEFSRQLVEEIDASLTLNKNAGMLPEEGVAVGCSSSINLERKIEWLEMAKKEVVRLLALTEQLVKEARYH